MTTIVGIDAKKDKSIILASDLTGTRTNWTPRGDVAYRRQTKVDYNKIHSNDDLAIATSGIIDESYFKFLEELLNGTIDFKNHTETGVFPQMAQINLERWEGRRPTDDLTGSLIALKDENPKLYTCWPLGKVERRDFTSIGSGSDYALEFLVQYHEDLVRGVSLNQGIDLAVKGLEEASKDIYTGGLDLTVVQKDNIQRFGPEIKDALNNAQKRVLKKIKDSFYKTK